MNWRNIGILRFMKNERMILGAMKALLVIVLCVICGCVSQSKYDQREKEISELKKQTAELQEKLSASQRTISEFEAHKFQIFQNGTRVWRLNTVTGDSCISLTSKADWKLKETKGQSCLCTDLFEDGHFKPDKILVDIYCGKE